MAGTVQGFPMTQEIVSGEPRDDPSQPLDSTSGADVPRGTKPTGKGFWLEGESEKVARDIDKRWSAQDKGMSSRLARYDLNVKRRDGDPYSKLIKSQDEDTYRVYTPPGVDKAPPSLNKTDDLSLKVVSNLLVDPPVPDCEPASDTDEDRGAAEFSTRVLANESTESGFNIPDHVRQAEDLACAFASGFVYAYVDPQGGGHRPREIMAPATATEIGPDGQPIIEDGTVGQPILRYVALDGTTITDDPTQAMLEWLPKLCGEDLTARNVRFIPETCSGIRDADGVMIAAFTQLGVLKARFPDVQAMTPEDWQKLVSYRPKIAKVLLPKYAGDGGGTKSGDWKTEDGPPDDALVFTITTYRRGTSEYPLGAYVVMGGTTLILHRQEWKEPITVKTGKTVDRAADIPVAQFRQYRDTKGQDPYGRGLVDLVSDGDPLRSFAIGAVVEYLHRVNNPHLFVPVGSGIQPKSLALPRGTPIPFNAAGGGTPQQEQIAPLPPAFMEFYATIGAEMDSRSGLEEAAQGLASPSVQSGTHAQKIIEQALVALGGPKQEMESGFMRLCRILLQLIRMHYTTPQRLKVTGTDNAFKEKEWTGADLGNTTDVKIKVGTSTMLTASAKSQIALEKLQSGAITLDDYQRSEEGNVRTLIGMQDNPHRQRIRGQIATWDDGPPENWQPPAPPQMPPNMGMQMPDERNMQQQPAPMAPPPPDPANPFTDRRAVDLLQPISLIRHNELSRAQSGSKYGSKAPAWKKYLDDEELAMRQGAGVMTVQEQKAAQAPQKPAPGSPAANWDAVVQTITGEVVGQAEKLVASIVDAQNGLGQPKGGATGTIPLPGQALGKVVGSIPPAGPPNGPPPEEPVTASNLLARHAQLTAKAGQEAEAGKTQSQIALSDDAHRKAVELATLQHGQAMEAKRMELDHASQMQANTPKPEPAAAPAPSPTHMGGVTVAPPDLSAVTEVLSAVHQTQVETTEALKLLAQKEFTVNMPEQRPQPIHVSVPSQAAPTINIPEQKAPHVTVNVPEQEDRKPRKRTGRITPNGDGSFSVVAEDDEGDE